MVGVGVAVCLVALIMWIAWGCVCVNAFVD